MTDDVPAHDPRQWVAERIDHFLTSRGMNDQDLAELMDVSGTTIFRWRTAQSNVSLNHQRRLMQILEVSEDDLREAGVVLPRVRTRGVTAAQPARAAGLTVTAESPNEPAAAEGRRVRDQAFAVCVQGVRDESFARLATRLDQHRRELVAALRQSNGSAEGRVRSSFARRVIVPKLADPSAQRVADLLADLRMVARPGDLALVWIWAQLGRDHAGDIQAWLGAGADAISLFDLAEGVARSAPDAAIVVEALWPDENRSFPGPNDAEHDEALRRIVAPGVPILVAALPWRDEHIAGWSYLSRLLVEGLQTGDSDLDGDGRVTVAELAEYAAGRIQPESIRALEDRAAGRPAMVVPVPRLLDPSSGDLVITSSL